MIHRHLYIVISVSLTPGAYKTLNAQLAIGREKRDEILSQCRARSEDAYWVYVWQ